ncbi:MAG: YidH family protein [Labedaea sp.]
MRDDGERPDYRFSLANERTFLAGIRTALALLAAGVGVIQFLTPAIPRAPRLALGLLLIALALLLAATAHRRWRRVEQAMRRNQPLPPSWTALIVSVGLTVAIVVTAVLMLIA